MWSRFEIGPASGGARDAEQGWKPAGEQEVAPQAEPPPQHHPDRIRVPGSQLQQVDGSEGELRTRAGTRLRSHAAHPVGDHHEIAINNLGVGDSPVERPGYAVRAL